MWLQETVLRRDMHLNAPKMAGHMTPTLPNFAPPVSALVTAANLNVIKAPTLRSAAQIRPIVDWQENTSHRIASQPTFARCQQRR